MIVFDQSLKVVAHVQKQKHAINSQTTQTKHTKKKILQGIYAVWPYVHRQRNLFLFPLLDLGKAQYNDQNTPRTKPSPWLTQWTDLINLKYKTPTQQSPPWLGFCWTRAIKKITVNVFDLQYLAKRYIPTPLSLGAIFTLQCWVTLINSNQSSNLSVGTCRKAIFLSRCSNSRSNIIIKKKSACMDVCFTTRENTSV